MRSWKKSDEWIRNCRNFRVLFTRFGIAVDLFLYQKITFFFVLGILLCFFVCLFCFANTTQFKKGIHRCIYKIIYNGRNDLIYSNSGCIMGFSSTLWQTNIVTSIELICIKTNGCLVQFASFDKLLLLLYFME